MDKCICCPISYVGDLESVNQTKIPAPHSTPAYTYFEKFNANKFE